MLYVEKIGIGFFSIAVVYYFYGLKGSEQIVIRGGTEIGDEDFRSGKKER